jgi:hypothetical protein
MAVNVSEFQSRRGEAGELRFDFIPDLPPSAIVEKITDTKPRGGIGETSSFIGKPRQSIRRQHGLSVHKHDMKPDGQRGSSPGDLDRFGERIPGHHQACRRQNAVLMRFEHCGVDLAGSAEIVGGNDEVHVGNSAQAQGTGIKVPVPGADSCVS